MRISNIKYQLLKKISLDSILGNRVVTPCQQFTYHQPSAKAYHNRQWLWDSCFQAIACRYDHLEISKSELLALIQHQVTTGANHGMIPHMRFWHESLGRTTAFDYDDRSWITNPPLIASAALLIAEKIINPKERQEFLEVIYQSIALMHDWFDRCRRIGSSPLVVNIHPWETGRDASIAWDEILPLPNEFSPQIKAIFLEKLNLSISEFLKMQLALYREEKQDLAFDFKDQRHQSRCVLNKLINLVNGDLKILNQELDSFCVYAIDYNSIRVKDLESMGQIAKILNFKKSIIDHWLARAELSRIAIREVLWNSKTGTFHDLQIFKSGEVKILPESAAAFVSFFGNVPSEEQSEKLCQRMLDASKYNRNYLIPSEPADSISYLPNVYWRGNVWPSVQWLIWHGLVSYKSNNLVTQDLVKLLRVKIATSLIKLVAEQGIYEYYNPETGAGLGEKDQSWTAVILDILNLELGT